VDRVIAATVLLVAALASLSTLGTAAMTKFSFEPTASAHFEERVGRPLMAPAVLALGASVVAAALLAGTLRRPRPVLAWTSALLSVFAIVVSLTATAEHRRRLDPRPELARELSSLDLGPDATVVLRTSRPLPDLPVVEWAYRVPLRKAAACERARAALKVWADPGTVTEGTWTACDLHARRRGSSVRIYATPEGASLTSAPDSYEDSLDPPVHYLLVEISACTGSAYPCTPATAAPRT